MYIYIYFLIWFSIQCTHTNWICHRSIIVSMINISSFFHNWKYLHKLNDYPFPVPNFQDQYQYFRRRMSSFSKCHSSHLLMWKLKKEIDKTYWFTSTCSIICSGDESQNVFFRRSSWMNTSRMIWALYNHITDTEATTEDVRVWGLMISIDNIEFGYDVHVVKMKIELTTNIFDSTDPIFGTDHCRHVLDKMYWCMSRLLMTKFPIKVVSIRLCRFMLDLWRSYFFFLYGLTNTEFKMIVILYSLGRRVIVIIIDRRSINDIVMENHLVHNVTKIKWKMMINDEWFTE